MKIPLVLVQKWREFATQVIEKAGGYFTVEMLKKALPGRWSFHDQEGDDRTYDYYELFLLCPEFDVDVQGHGKFEVHKPKTPGPEEIAAQMGGIITLNFEGNYDKIMGNQSAKNMLPQDGSAESEFQELIAPLGAQVEEWEDCRLDVSLPEDNLVEFIQTWRAMEQGLHGKIMKQLASLYECSFSPGE